MWCSGFGVTHMMASGWKKRRKRQATIHFGPHEAVVSPFLVLLSAQQKACACQQCYVPEEKRHQATTVLSLSPMEWEAGSLGIRQPFKDVKDTDSFQLSVLPFLRVLSCFRSPLLKTSVHATFLRSRAHIYLYVQQTLKNGICVCFFQSLCWRIDKVGEIVIKLTKTYLLWEDLGSLI